MNDSNIMLSIFLPVYNEADILPGLIERTVGQLNQWKLRDYELLIIDDGSDDGSTEVADDLARRFDRVRAVHHGANRGYGAALRTGFETAIGDWICFMDGDGQFDAADFERLWSLTDRYDVVLGYRIERSDHLGRKLNAWLWSLIVWWVVRLRVRDIDCGFKMFKREALEQALPLLSQGAVISTELLIKLKMARYQFGEVGVRHFPRLAGKPTGANGWVIARAIRELVVLRRRLKGSAPGR